MGGELKPRPAGASATGRVDVARAPAAVGGALEIDVVAGEIANLRRVSLREMRKAKPVRPIDVRASAALQIAVP